jgi:hypothetical protein
MIGQYLPNKTKVILFIGLKFFHNLNVAPMISEATLCTLLKASTILHAPLIHTIDCDPRGGAVASLFVSQVQPNQQPSSSIFLSQ